MSEINCTNCAVSDFKESLCHRCAEMKRLGRAEDIEGLLIKAFSEVDSPAKSDCIERQAAIDALERTKEKDPKGDIACFYNTITDNKIAVIEALPSASPKRCADCENLSKTQLLIPQPEQKWIPCSERLPEIGQSVLLSVGGMYSAEGCLREDGDWAQFRWDAIQRKDMVGAWKPLPEPYKGDRRDAKAQN